jgi:SAM-dependent methyltransferase
MNCPICAGDEIELKHENIFDDRYGCPMLVSVHSCKSCTHHFIWPRMEPESIAPLYETYYGRSETEPKSVETGAYKSVKTSSFSRWLFGTNNLGQYLAPDRSKLLDIGSGDCQNLFEANLLGHTSSGFDVDSNSQKIGDALKLNVRSGLAPKKVFRENEFDWIQLNQVIEHYIDPVEEMKEIVSLLKPGGRVFIATPNSGSIYRAVFGRKWINWHVPFHQHHFSMNSVKGCLERSGLTVEFVSTVTPLVWSQIQIRSLFVKVAPGQPSDLWDSMSATKKSFSASNSLQKTMLRKLVTLLRFGASGVLVVIARISDQLRLGDSLVVVAIKPE